MTDQWTICLECDVKVQNGNSRPENSKGLVQVRTDGLPERSGARPGAQCLLIAHVKEYEKYKLHESELTSFCLRLSTMYPGHSNGTRDWPEQAVSLLHWAPAGSSVPGHTSRCLRLLCLITACVVLRDWLVTAKTGTASSSITSITPKLH